MKPNKPTDAEVAAAFSSTPIDRAAANKIAEGKTRADRMTLDACFALESGLTPGTIRFLDSLDKWLRHNLYLTDAQRRALEDIARRHDVTVTRRP